MIPYIQGTKAREGMAILDVREHADYMRARAAGFRAFQETLVDPHRSSLFFATVGSDRAPRR